LAAVATVVSGVVNATDRLQIDAIVVIGYTRSGSVVAFRLERLVVRALEIVQQACAFRDVIVTLVEQCRRILPLRAQGHNEPLLLVYAIHAPGTPMC
jgi:TctA family transporter